MRKMGLTMIAMLLASSLANADAHRGNGGGNGGDALRELLERARSAAAATVQNLQWCSFKSTVKKETVDWILANQTAIANDIRSSQHLWVVDDQATCGFTSGDSAAPIYLSYPTCASTVGNSLNSAIFVVLHETAHHFGVSNERDADAIAKAIQEANLNTTCPASDDITDPGVCSSGPMTTEDAQRYFSAGDTSVMVPVTYRVYGRISRCVTLSGCEPWKEWELKTGLGSDWLQTLQLQLFATQSTPYFSGYIWATERNGNSGRSSYFGEAFDIDVTSGRELWFYGSSYRGDHTVYMKEDTDSKIGRMRKNCVWNKWAQTFDYGSGLTEKIEVYLHGTF